MTVVGSLRSQLALLTLLSVAFVDAGAQETVRAVLPVEVLPLDAGLGAGAITSSSWKVVRPKVALQPARAARAVVLTGSGKGKVLALALLGKLESTPDGVWYEWSVAPGEERIWKNMRSRRARDNAGFVLLGEAVLKLAPSADGSTVSVNKEIGSFEAEGEISVPRDPVSMR